jgi:hypothetical protein
LLKAIVDAIHFAQFGAQNPLDAESENLDMDFKRKYSLCGRILFRNDAYTS